jgi:DNA replication protein DnaC
VTNIGEALRDVQTRLNAILDNPAYQEQIARNRESDEADEQRERERQRAARLKLTGVPPEVATARADQSAARAAVEEFLDAPPACRFLVLSGRKGTGKTFASAEAIWNHGGRYRDAQQLVSLGMFDRESTDELVNTRLLVVDELGAEYPNPAFEAALYALLDRRYRAGKRTVLCTNLNAADFRSRYCDAGLDRLLDRIKSGGRWVSLDGPSLRRHWSEGGDVDGVTP